MQNDRKVTIRLTKSKIASYKMLAEYFAKKYRNNIKQKS